LGCSVSAVQAAVRVLCEFLQELGRGVDRQFLAEPEEVLVGSDQECSLADR
jgi:hypothetical protein